MNADPNAAIWEKAAGMSTGCGMYIPSRRLAHRLDRKSPAWVALQTAYRQWLDSMKPGPSRAIREFGMRRMAQYMVAESFIAPDAGIPDCWFYIVTCDDQDRFAAVEAWKQDMLEYGYKPKSIHTYLDGPRSFSKFLVRRGLMSGPITNEGPPIPDLRLTIKKRPTPSIDMLSRLLGAIECGDAMGARDYAMIRVMIDLGIRVTECCQIRFADFCPSQGEQKGHIVIRTIKNRHGTESPEVAYTLPLQTEEAIRHWIAMRPKLLRDPPYMFFQLHLGHMGKKLDRRNVAARIEHWRKHAKLAGKIPPHAIRRFAATQARRAMETLGLDQGDVSEFMRHSSWKTTEIYIEPDIAARSKLAQYMADLVPPRRGSHLVAADGAV